MTSQWQVELDDAGRQTETSRGLPARPAAALLILVALTFIDATPRMALDAEFIECATKVFTPLLGAIEDDRVKVRA